ncbi:formate/nitrite transporter family protein [Halovivax cerinus]|uniref:Formate/nitrite transporter family protein n=1 Tax=Halovivax cerinus TaxID=1487865 RepID=A0ABD5NKP8_9EURY|nr:formate/nitrite transporter family protein [Halovivax cerinus]
MPASDGSADTRESSERSETDVPTSGEVVPERFSSDELFQRIIADADHEITSGTRELFFSAVAGGLAISITFLVYASLYPQADGGIARVLLYPLGFIYIIIGGYQLYTENTLPPVLLTLERLASVPSLLRHWLIVLLGNFAGGAIGAIVLAYGGVFEGAAVDAAVTFAQDGVATARWDLFFKGAFAGLVVAGLVWVDFAARDTISRVVLIYIAFLTIPLGNLFHVVVSFTEVIFAMLVTDQIAFIPGMTDFVLPVLLGNTIGGVVLLTVVNYYQTSEHRLESGRFEDARKLSVREWLAGGLAGRTYVPVVDTIEEIVRDTDSYRVLVPISNPRTERDLVKLACTLAGSRKTGAVHVVHFVQAPERGSFHGDPEQHDRIVDASERQLETFEPMGEHHDVEFQTSTVVTPRSFEDVFDTANRLSPDLVLMGWGRDTVWSSARAERPLDELTNQLPTDFLIVRDRGLEPDEILLPTAGGPNADLGAEIAGILQTTADIEVTLLHVVDGPAEREAGERFLHKLADDYDLEEPNLVVDASGDIERAICDAAHDRAMVIIGASERGLLSRLVTDSLHLSILDDVEGSMLLAERPSERTFIERLIGAGSRENRRE